MQTDTADNVWRRGDRARLVRVFSMGATIVYGLLGLGLSTVTAGPREIVLVAVLGVSFHLFAFPLNDVVDLPIDSTNPRRADGPLVRGLVQPGVMLGLAVAQVPVMAIILLAGQASGTAFAAWAVAVGGLGAYDVWGKRMRIPVVPDLVQGVGFAALFMMGAHWVAPAQSTAWIVAASVVVYIVQINAVHGGLRDLGNDVAHGARTTPILLGCGVDEGGTPTLSSPMVGLAVVTELAMIGLLVAFAVGSSGIWQAATAIAALLIKLSASWIGVRAYMAMADQRRMMALGVWNLFWSLCAVVVAPLGGFAVGLALVTLVAFLAPPGYFARVTS